MEIYNKFNMTVEENIFVAKRNIVDYIYKSARLEGLGVTFPDTEAIVNGGTVLGIKADEVVAINNLKHAWQFILENIDYPTEYPLICEINRYVGANLFSNAGYIRSIPVTIGGTSWRPQLPIEVDIREEINEVMAIENSTDCAITLMLALMRWQMFLDGNKRTAILAANHEMIMNGAGIISIPVEHITDFTIKLVNFYETGDMQDIKQFVFDTSVDGLDMEKARKVQTSTVSFNDWKKQIDDERAKNEK